MDHLAMFTKFYNQAATSILIPLLSLSICINAILLMCYAMRIDIGTLDAVCKTTKA